MNFDKFRSDVLFSSGRLVFSIARRLLLIRIITNLIGADGYGVWVALLALLRLFTSMGNLHFDGALIRFSSEHGDRKQTFVNTLAGVLLSGIIFAVGVIVLNEVFGILSFVGTKSERLLVLGAAIFVFSDILYKILLNYPRTEGRVKTFELIWISRLILEAVVVIPIIIITHEVTTAFFGLVGIVVLLDLILLKAFFPAGRYVPELDSYKEYLRYSLPMIPKEFAQTVLSEADKFLIIYLISPSATGIYAVGYSVSVLLSNLTVVLDSTMYPSVIKAWDAGEYGQLKMLYESIYKWYSLIGVPAFVGLSLLSYPVLQLISTPEIANKGAIVVPILGFGFFLRGYENPLTYVLAANKTTGDIAKIHLASATLNVGLNLALLPRIGLVGAAVATTISQIVIVVYVYSKVQAELSFLIPFRHLGKVAVSTVAMILPLLFVSSYVGWQAKLLLYPVLGGTVYMATVFLTGALSVRQLRQLVESN